MPAIRGEDGELRWGYRRAGALEHFTIAKGAGAVLVLTGRVVRPDPFTLAQRPLVFIWPLGARRWTYPLEAVDLVGDQLTAQLGARQD